MKKPRAVFNPLSEIPDGCRELKLVDGMVVGYVCIECGRLNTAPHLDTCSRRPFTGTEDDDLPRGFVNAARKVLGMGAEGK